MQVSVPGIYQNPAPYREQIFTYSTALAFTGRSAACAPPTANRPAAEPSKRLLTNFMLNLQVCSIGKVPDPLGEDTLRLVPFVPLTHRSAASRLRTHPHEREGLKRTT